MKNFQKILIIVGGVILLGAAIVLGVLWFSSDAPDSEGTPIDSIETESESSRQIPSSSEVPSVVIEQIARPPLPIDPAQRDRKLKEDFQDILETEFSERFLSVNKVVQVEEYAAASWTDQNAGGLVFLVYTNNGWRILNVGGGYPYPQDLADEFGMSIETAEQLLDEVFPEWREFQD